MARKNLGRLAAEGRLTDKQREFLFMLAQLRLFGAFPDAPLERIETHLGLKRAMTRRHAGSLEERGLVKKVSSRPITFVLTKKGETGLGIGDV